MTCVTIQIWKYQKIKKLKKHSFHCECQLSACVHDERIFKKLPTIVIYRKIINDKKKTKVETAKTRNPNKKPSELMKTLKTNEISNKLS